jgi:hypothetical protein
MQLYIKETIKDLIIGNLFRWLARYPSIHTQLRETIITRGGARCLVDDWTGEEVVEGPILRRYRARLINDCAEFVRKNP